MSDIKIVASEDIDEFVKQSNEYKEPDEKTRFMRRIRLEDVAMSDGEPTESKVNTGQVCQYSEYGPGYKASPRTIPSLPCGVYDIQSDSNGIFAVPALPPSGLLLELPEMRSDEVIQMVGNFWASEAAYKEGNQWIKGGAIFKQGILLYGVAGTGKTCTLKIVSKKLIEKGGTVFYASNSPQIVQAFLTDFSRIENNRKCIVILEDIDALIEKFGEQEYLQLLDSAKSINNCLFLATTNFPDKLEARMWSRPGRLGHVIKIGLPSKAAREAYLKAILKDYKDIPYILEHSEGFSIDHLTATVNGTYREGRKLETEIARIRKLFQIPKTGEGKTIGF